MKDEFEKLLKQKMDLAYSEFLCRVVDFHEDVDVKKEKAQLFLFMCGYYECFRDIKLTIHTSEDLINARKFINNYINHLFESYDDDVKFYEEL